MEQPISDPPKAANSHISCSHSAVICPHTQSQEEGSVRFSMIPTKATDSLLEEIQHVVAEQFSISVTVFKY